MEDFKRNEEYNYTEVDIGGVKYVAVSKKRAAELDPNFVRGIEHEFKLNGDGKKSVCGIYKIVIGDFFYIGASKNIGIRINSHEHVINKLLRNAGLRLHGWHIKLLPYLRDNPIIKVGQVSILSLCEPTQLHKEENKALKKHRKEPGSLNYLLDSTYSKS